MTHRSSSPFNRAELRDVIVKALCNEQLVKQITFSIPSFSVSDDSRQIIGTWDPVNIRLIGVPTRAELLHDFSSRSTILTK